MKKLLLTSFLLAVVCQAGAQIITTIAGTGVPGYTGDNGPAINANLHQPSGVILDKKGNLFFGDFGNSVIRKIDTFGIITTIAGTGSTGYNGDSIPATDAKLYGPWSIAIDDTGSIFVADYGNNRIRKIDTFGIITTVAGTGFPGYNGDSIYATTAQLNGPYGITLDVFGNIYTADFGNHRIRMVDTAGIITTVAGTGVAGTDGDGGSAVLATVYNPYGIISDPSGNIFFSDEMNCRIRKFNPHAGGIITTVAGNDTCGYMGDNVPATATTLDGPFGVTLDSIGNLYIGDEGNSRIRKVDTAGIITTIAGNGTGGFGGDNGNPLLAELHNPINAVVGRNGNIYIADNGNDRVRFIRYNVWVNNINGVAGGIIIYPNPCNGTFSLLISSTISEPVQIVITNLLGEQVCDINATSNLSMPIQLNVSPGLYFITAVTAHETFTGQVSIVR